MTKLILDACNNHLGNKAIMEKMIIEASSYAEYIKFQLYDASMLNPKYPNYPEVYSRMKECEIDIPRLKWIIDFCKYSGIIPMFTIFTENRIADLQIQLGNFALKVASPDMTNQYLIDQIKAAFPSKELFISCGMSSMEEIQHAKSLNKEKNIKWLYCISKYPTAFEDIQFLDMQMYNGFSDHTIGLEAIKMALFFNPDLEYIEKHFTLSKNLPITDRDWSVEPEELMYLSSQINYVAHVQKYKTRWVG